MSLRDRIVGLARAVLPARARRAVVDTQRTLGLQWPRVGNVDFGSLRRLTPISPVFGMDRGLPIERYYIERFLDRHKDDIRGVALEAGDDTYLRRFGGDQVSRREILSVVDQPPATVVADLTDADHIPSDSFDCIVLTQTIQMIYDVRAALVCLHRILRPSGVLLLTTHGTSRIGRHRDKDAWSEYWHLTAEATEALMEETFPGARIDVDHVGNVFTAISALHGLASEELTQDELDYKDRDFQVIVTVRAQKSGVERTG